MLLINDGETRNQAMAKQSAKNEASKIEARLAHLESEVASLRESINAKTTGVVSEGKFWAIETLKNTYPEMGGVVFGGYVKVPTEKTYAWQIESRAEELYQADWSVAQSALAALAHPVRLAILKALLHGQSDTQSLQAIPEIGTTGQLYHHVKELEAAGWIRQPRRGEYNLLAERIVPLLAILAACEVQAGPELNHP